jgi:hypothetical protein
VSEGVIQLTLRMLGDEEQMHPTTVRSCVGLMAGAPGAKRRYSTLSLNSRAAPVPQETRHNRGVGKLYNKSTSRSIKKVGMQPDQSSENLQRACVIASQLYHVRARS